MKTLVADPAFIDIHVGGTGLMALVVITIAVCTAAAVIMSK